MKKPTPEEENRFDEVIRQVNNTLVEMMTRLSENDVMILKQHIANEIARAKREGREELKKEIRTLQLAGASPETIDDRLT